MKGTITVGIAIVLLVALILLLGNQRSESQVTTDNGVHVPTPEIVTLVVAAAASGDWSHTVPDMTPGMAPLISADAIEGIKTAFGQLGPMQSVETLTGPSASGATSYRFTVHLAKGDIVGSLLIDGDGKIAGMRFEPGKMRATPSSGKAGYITKGDVHLPFRGEWYALWGGTDPATNQPHMQAGGSQRYAYDLLIVRNGATHMGDGAKNSDYYAYGQPILSPVAGTVITVIDGIPENKPGETNALFAPGNSVVIDDGLEEYFALCHLQPEQMKVKVGDRVQPGQPIGLCGNSGNATEPHLHFQMQDGPDMATANGLPITFHHFLQEGKLVVAGIAAGKVHLQNEGTLPPPNSSH